MLSSRERERERETEGGGDRGRGMTGVAEVSVRHRGRRSDEKEREDLVEEGAFSRWNERGELEERGVRRGKKGIRGFGLGFAGFHIPEENLLIFPRLNLTEPFLELSHVPTFLLFDFPRREDEESCVSQA